jgi:hypothetical protein
MHSGVDQYAVQSYETAAHERILVDVPVFGFMPKPALSSATGRKNG